MVTPDRGELPVLDCSGRYDRIAIVKSVNLSIDQLTQVESGRLFAAHCAENTLLKEAAVPADRAASAVAEKLRYLG